MHEYSERYLAIEGTKPAQRLAVDLLHHYTIGRFGYCIDKVLTLSKQIDELKNDREKVKELINYRLFKKIAKLPILFADKYWMKYTPTKNLINVYFQLLVQKLQAKRATDKSANDKLAQAYITYSLF